MKNLNFETAGNPEKPALILIHGLMSSNFQWVLNKEVLSKKYFLVMIEMWDHGDSPDSSTVDDHSPDMYSDQLMRIYKKLGITSASVLGHSMGAAILIHFAQQHPDMVDTVLFTNSKVVVTDLNQSLKKVSDRTGGISERLFDEELFQTEEARLSFKRKLPMHPVHAKSMPEELKPKFVRMADEIRFECIQYAPQIAKGLCCYKLLAELSMPILVLNGVFEKDIQPHIAELMEKFPDIKVVDISAGHNVNIDGAHQFNQIVLNYLDAHYATRQVVSGEPVALVDEAEPA